MRCVISCFFMLASLMTPLSAVGAESQSKVLEDGKFLLTIFLRHDQSMTVNEINTHIKKTGFLKMFPPEGVDIVSWNVVMGIGQVVMLRVPPDKLRAVNLSVEKGAWGAFRSEFYPSYDLWPIIKEQKRAQNR